MEINKDNAIEEVSNLIKSKKIPFTYDDGVFELLVGTESCYIQVEIIGTEEQGNDVTMQFYDNPENSIYEEFDDIDHIDKVEEYLDQMLIFMKDKIKKIAKILSHINAINTICEELDIDPETFIEVMYDFSSYE